MCLKRSSSPENGRASLTMTFLRAARRASISALILSIDVARNAGAGVDARRPAGRSVRGLVMVFSFFFAGEARHRDVDDEGGRPVGRAVRRVAGDDSEGAFVVVHGQQLGPLLEVIVEDVVGLRGVAAGAGRRRNRGAENAGKERQGATGHS